MKFKKLLAVLLSFSMIMSVSVVAWADDTAEPVTDESVTQESITESDSSEEIVSEEAAEETSEENGIVATLSLCSVVYVWPISGHTFIYVQNNSDEPIQVGHYEVPVGQGVSVGSFSFSVHDGWGLYYNIEGYKENIRGRIGDVWSISEELDVNELETLNDSLRSYPNYWGFGANCATFAFSIWNSVTGDHFVSLLIPAISEFMVMVGGGKKGVLPLYLPERNQIMRQKGTGEDAYLVVASDGTIS